jgi:hypothetical protein
MIMSTGRSGEAEEDEVVMVRWDRQGRVRKAEAREHFSRNAYGACFERILHEMREGVLLDRCCVWFEGRSFEKRWGGVGRYVEHHRAYELAVLVMRKWLGSLEHRRAYELAMKLVMRSVY